MFLCWLTEFYCSGQIRWPSPLSTHVRIEFRTCWNSLVHRCQESWTIWGKKNKTRWQIKQQNSKPHACTLHRLTATDMKTDWLLNQVSASHSCPPWKQSSEGMRTDNISWHSIFQNQSLSVTAQKSRGTFLPSAARRKGWVDPLGAHKASS